MDACLTIAAYVGLFCAVLGVGAWVVDRAWPWLEGKYRDRIVDDWLREGNERPRFWLWR